MQKYYSSLPVVQEETFDVVIPNGDEKAFIDIALWLGYKKIVFLSSNPKYAAAKDTRITIKTAYLLKDPSDVGAARKHFDYVFANAERKFFEKKIDYIINSEMSDRRDSFHYRNTSLNQVHAKLARDNKINIIFSFNQLLNNNWRIALGRMIQNAAVAKKYRLKHSAFSLARTPMEMRSKAILDAYEKVLGLY